MSTPFPTDTRLPKPTTDRIARHPRSESPRASVDAAPLLPPGERGELELTESLRLTYGGVIREPRVAYEMVGPAGAPVVVVAGGISAGRHVTPSTADPSPGWWSDFAGPGRAVDTDRFRVLAFDFLGGNGRTTGPRTEPDAEAEPTLPFPEIDTRDQAALLAALLDDLGIPRIHAFVGSSYGGMVALAFAAEHGPRVDRLAVISAGHRPHPQSTAWRSVQRRIVRLGAAFGRPSEGLALSRALAMVTYRSPDELAARFDGPPRSAAGGFRFPVEEYLDARGADFAGSFDPQAFVTLSQSIDLHRVDPAAIRTPTTLVAVRSDQLVPAADLRVLASSLGAPCRLVEIDSLYGHDAFLKEIRGIGDAVAHTLAETPSEEH